MKVLLTAAIVAFCAGTGMAAAKPAPEPTEQVTVFAPYLVQKAFVGPTRSPVQVITISRAVSYHDLDLKTEAGAASLEARVKQAADDICRELDRRYPRTVYAPIAGGRNCAQFAADTSLIEVREIVAAVRGG
jgi:UrcA family protein